MDVASFLAGRFLTASLCSPFDHYKLVHQIRRAGLDVYSPFCLNNQGGNGVR
jgi:hypothetical protein